MDADCKQGYEWATTQLPDLVRDQATIDTSRGVGVIGASAGAHLSLLMVRLALAFLFRPVQPAFSGAPCPCIVCVVADLRAIRSSFQIANVLKSSSAPKPAVALAFYPLTKSDDGSLGPVEAWEQHRAQKPEEVAYAEQVYKGEQIVSVPILKFVFPILPFEQYMSSARTNADLQAFLPSSPDSLQPTAGAYTSPGIPRHRRRVRQPLLSHDRSFRPKIFSKGSLPLLPRRSRLSSHLPRLGQCRSPDQASPEPGVRRAVEGAWGRVRWRRARGRVALVGGEGLCGESAGKRVLGEGDRTGIEVCSR
jgi:hypothetical protein